jgi:hypothetical protein
VSDLVKHYRQLVGIAKGWAVKNLAGWDDEMHRELLARHGGDIGDGRPSASNLNLPQLSAVLEDYAARGWLRRKQYAPAGADKPKTVSPQIGHIVKLWGKLGQAGKVDNATRPALLAWCARQTAKNVPDLDSLSADEMQSLIEAMKGWLGR